MPEYSELGKSTENSSNIENVEKNDADYGDGDGVNEFDSTYNEMQNDSSDFKYEEDDSNDASGASDDLEEKKTEMSSEERANEIDTGIENDVSTNETAEIDEKRLPKSDGHWEGEKGDSLWVPDDDKIPGKANPENKSWGEIKDKYNIDGIEYNNGDPDFSDLSRGEAHVDEFTADRYKNFKQADEIEAEKRGCSPEDVKQWRQDNGYTWHERADCETMDKVPSIVHNNVVHSGGISEKKKEMNLEGWM